MSRDHRLMLLAAAAAVALTSCGPAAQPVQTGPAAAPPPVAGEIAEPSGPSKDAPLDRSIGALTAGEERQVRIKGRLSAIIGMRLVPPKLIFKVTDASGTVLAVINEKAQLKEGTKLELVGTYHEIPSPMYSGPGEAPKETVFEVERYLDLP
jgi:hypothetical protein